MGISEIKTERGLYVEEKLFKILISISTTYSKIIEVGGVAVLVDDCPTSLSLIKTLLFRVPNKFKISNSDTVPTG